MLTLTQSPAPYGYQSVHDLPTPPSTLRPSPPPTYQEAAYKSSSTGILGHSPSRRPMTTPHRGLPPPAAMALPPQQPPPSASAPPAPHHGQPQGSLAHAAQQGQAWSALPPPPQQWQGAEESMRNWLLAKTEEERTRQEEEKTRQEGLRLEQRRVEMDILRASLSGGIPPPMIPIVFAGMGVGGTLPQTALEWAQHYVQSAQAQQPQLPAPQRPHSPEHHPRDAPAPAQGPFSGSATNPPPAQASGAYGHYPASPTRPRGQTVTGALGRHGPSVPGAGTSPAQPGTSGGAPMSQYQTQQQAQAQGTQQDTSSSLYFHYWQPPSASQGGAGGSNRPGTPSGDMQRKRKQVIPQHQQHHPMQAPSEPRLRSPPTFIQSSLSHPPAGRRTHKRQKSDVAWYRPAGYGQGEESQGTASTKMSNREADGESSREAYNAEGRKHSVSALLSQEPPDRGPRTIYHQSYGPSTAGSEPRDGGGGSRDRTCSPGKGEIKMRGGAASSAESQR
ncbi:hypothetical protein HIM_00134 [Hirsutella minnesotensis 3608]|nr:hypothetical protein HIM_00134 [Hirsutella minnesotensis 3608]